MILKESRHPCSRQPRKRCFDRGWRYKVAKGQSGQVFISTSGVGFADPLLKIGESAQPGDMVSYQGRLVIMELRRWPRNELGFRTIKSDVAP